QTLGNLLAALREGDFSIRGRTSASHDALDDVLREINSLGDTLRTQRLGAVEATALLQTVMAEIDVAVFAFDEGARLRLINRAGAELLAQPEAQLLSRSAAELGLEDLLSGDAPRTIDAAFADGRHPRELRRGSF